MCRIPDPPKEKNCRCGHPAVYNGKCGHCFIRLVLDPLEKRSRKSTIVIGGGGHKKGKKR
jgi:hypothetical protein